MSTEHVQGPSSNAGHQGSRPNLNPRSVGSSLHSDEDTDDIVGASVNFALRRASSAMVWYRQENLENGGPWSGKTASCQQSYFHTITPSSLENSSPLQTQFKPIQAYSSEMRSQSASSSLSSPSLQDYPQEERDSQSGPEENLKKSTSTSSEEPTTFPTRKPRRRKIENVDPSSARARHLEKNREAASKCRRNQKRKTDNLVEKARNMEEKNRILKVEVACLKADMASLMDVVASHCQCSDNRLRTYVQREADLLADGRRKNVGEPLSGGPFAI